MVESIRTEKTAEVRYHMVSMVSMVSMVNITLLQLLLPIGPVNPPALVSPAGCSAAVRALPSHHRWVTCTAVSAVLTVHCGVVYDGTIPLAVLTVHCGV
jgi:hypothetical protein